ncbi:MAG TPA: vitamin B12-dependent ribonucleotide reductase [Thermoanaerobaculia bacterium]|nr:vitamin B12-dependent ribonucleotide reductase [Thermoanaerobaculia bacterium]
MSATEKDVPAPKSTAAAAERAAAARSLKGLEVRRVYSDPSISPYDAIEWELRTAAITSEKGETIFEQKNVEVPKSWSQTATNIVAQKYFHGRLGTSERETSVKQLIERVVRTITGYGEKGGYFRTAADRDAFRDELAAILVNQVASFNSPVWFNVGIEGKPQASACFINSCGDSMDSILSLAKTEGMLFKFGSGTGSNLSNLRGSTEGLSSGGTASGPLSFMKGFDSFAGAIKSGGKTRRAAKMVILNIDHPDIEDFVLSKANEERKAWALIDAGYDGSFNGEAYGSIFYQNATHSVRVTDEFMHAVETDGEWWTKEVLTGKPFKKYQARKLLSEISEAAWVCGDPGMQYDTTINRWNPVKTTHRINASNPCSEYMFVDDSACNLASLNLMKFFKPDDGSFDVETFRHACDIVISAQEMLVDNASYPTQPIAENSYKFRPLGLGYANLGALLMATGLPYDSDEGRAYAAAITSLMCGEAYLESSRIAAELGPFAGYAPNRDAFLDVIAKHRDAAYEVASRGVPAELSKAERAVWDAALESGRQYGYKNAQVTVLAPTGTIGFMMDCDTTGVEPDLALVKYKKLVGGGTIKIVNNTVPLALKRLGYTEPEINQIVDYVDEKGTIEGAPGFKAEHLPVFDCAFRALNGSRSIHYMGHVKMMGAVQPFLSGAISKTVNLPSDATPDEIAGVYMEGWKEGLKAIAIYRDGCKRTQPLNTAASASDSKTPEKRTSLEYVGKAVAPTAAPFRRKLPDERRAITHKFSVAGHEGYITVGLYEDGKPGEIFLTMSKEGSTISGLMDSFATAVSLTLQYGVPLEALVDKFTHMRFEPSGFTKNPEIPMAKSLVDYIFKWLGSKFLTAEEKKAIGVIARDTASEAPVPVTEQVVLARAKPDPPGGQRVTFETSTDAPACHECGSIMVRSAACYKCMNCGATSGCS